VIGPGLGYLAGGLLVAGLWVAWLRAGKGAAGRFVETCIRSGQAASPRWRIINPWGSPQANDPAERRRMVFWAWLPATLFLPVFAFVLLASAVVDLTR
jgi:hypothetical protein